MQRVLTRLAAAALVAAGLLLFTGTSPASAHTARTVAGKYNLVVGWGDEPTYSGFKNSVQLLLSDAAHKPIVDLGDTLKVEVVTGTQKTTLPIVANFEVGEFGEPGDYRAWFVPTRPGDYTFHFTGTVRGDAIDESFTSSDTTFDPAEDPTEVQFPVKDPTAGQLAQRLDQETKRAATNLATAKAEAKTSADKATKATILGVAGIVVGALGLALAGVGIVRRR